MILILSAVGCSVFVLPGGYAVSGTIEDTDGNPLSGVTLTFGGERSFGTATTDAVGNWRKSGLIGEVIVTPDLEGFTFDPENAVVQDQADDVDFVGAGETATPGLVMHLDFEETLVSQEGFEPIAQPSEPRFVPGISGMGVEITSSDDLFDFVLDDVLNPEEGTITFWFQSYYTRESGDTTERGFWEWYCTSGGRFDNGLIFFSWQSRGGNLHNRVNNNRENSASASYPYQIGQWYHIAVTWSASDNAMAWFVDGVEQDRDSFTVPIIDPTESIQLRLGSGHSSSSVLDGVMDEFKLYNYAMTTVEIADQYDAELPESPYLLYDDFSGSLLNPSLWTVTSGSVEVTGGQLIVQAPSLTRLWTKNSFAGDFTIDIEIAEFEKVPENGGIMRNRMSLYLASDHSEEEVRLQFVRREDRVEVRYDGGTDDVRDVGPMDEPFVVTIERHGDEFTFSVNGGEAFGPYPHPFGDGEAFFGMQTWTSSDGPVGTIYDRIIIQ